jgi:hypothetical protein
MKETITCTTLFAIVQAALIYSGHTADWNPQPIDLYTKYIYFLPLFFLSFFCVVYPAMP